jgi:hypothetical protein
VAVEDGRREDDATEMDSEMEEERRRFDILLG